MSYKSKPWLKSYDSGIPENIDIPAITLKDYLVQSCKDFPDKAVANYMGASMTYGELLEKSGRFATALAKQGLGKGDVVAVCLPNTPQYHHQHCGRFTRRCARFPDSPPCSCLTKWPIS